jgi:hypothetical protein
MDEHAWLAERFEEHRSRLGAVAYRMVGSLGEADEAVQEGWLGVSRLGAGEIDNPSGQNPACLSAESQQKNRGATDYWRPFSVSLSFGAVRWIREKWNSANFALTEFSEVASGDPMVRSFSEEYQAVQSPTRSREAVHRAHEIVTVL